MENEQLNFEFSKQPTTKRPTIKGFPELRWTGKRPYEYYESTVYYPAQLKEKYGEEQDNWINKIFWGDNLQVMNHLKKDYRGKVDLVYIDPPFDSKADYKKTIEIRGVGKAESDNSSFEEKQYGDIWTNDEYLQFMYERLLLIKDLLSSKGSIYLHCDWHRAAFLKLLLDEVFGIEKFRNEIVWSYFGFKRATSRKFPQKHDLIYSYTMSDEYTWNVQYKPHSPEYIKRFKKDKNGRLFRDDVNPTGGGSRIIYLDEVQGDIVDSVWNDIPPVNPVAKERCDYPTQKPEKLIERIIKASSNPGDLVFDCFMGSGTTMAVAMKLGRRFIGADINLGAIQTATKRLISVANELEETLDTDEDDVKYTGFEVYNVNNYDIFRNPVEARDLITQALNILPPPQGSVWDGVLEGRMVKIMPINRIATKADLEGVKANLPYKTYDKRKKENPGQPVENITIICMGHEPDLKVSLEQDLSDYKFDIEIVDILQDKKELQFKREAEAEIAREGKKLVIRSFYPMNLLQKLSAPKDKIDDWRYLVESIMIDWNYDGVVMQPTLMDIPDKRHIVSGTYDIPDDAGTIRVKITDLLSESIEKEMKA